MDLEVLSKQRIKDAQSKYGDSWKKFTREDIIGNVEEELADAISYISFYEKLFGEVATEYKAQLQVIYDNIKYKFKTEDDKNKKLMEWTVGKI